jgi:hypothetical protein
MKWFALSVLVAVSVSARASETRDFVKIPVRSTAELIQRIQNDPLVARYYERHYKMTRNQIVDFVGRLHSMRLLKETAYCLVRIGPDGAEETFSEAFAANTDVFANGKGETVLIQKTGDPVAQSDLVGDDLLAQCDPGLADESPSEALMAEAQPDLDAPPVDAATATAPADGSLAGALAAGGLIYGLSTSSSSMAKPLPAPTPEHPYATLMGVALMGVVLGRRRRL